MNKACDEKNRSVHVPGIRGEIMEQILQYAYTRRCVIDENSVHELLVSADYVGLVSLINHCKKFIGDMLSPESCVDIMGFSK